MAVERVEGVREAAFSYAMGDGYVMYDETQTSPSDIIAELQRVTAYTAMVRENAGDHEEEDGNQP